MGSFSAAMARGGVLMWPLLFCSLVTVTVTLERLTVFAGVALTLRMKKSRVDLLYDALVRNQVDEAIAIGLQAGPLGRFVSEGLAHRECGLEQSLEEAGQELLSRMGRRLSVLDTLVTLAPMLGILGTVTGIIGSFHLLGTAEAGGDPATVSVGIAEALVTTAAGLVVSMMALVPFNMFKSRLAGLARTLERAGRHACRAFRKGGGHEA